MNDQNNPLDPEDILWWKNRFKSLDTQGIDIGRKEIIKDFWSRDFPLEETLAICLIRWPDTSLEYVTKLYADETRNFLTVMGKERGFKVKEIKLSKLEPTDLAGIPTVDKER